MDRVSERSEGELIFKLLGGPEVIGTFEQGIAVQRGVVDMSQVFAFAYDGVVSGGRALELSRLTPWEEREVGVYDFLQDMYEKGGLFYLGRGFYNAEPQFNLFTKERVEKPWELAGKRITGVIMTAGVKELGMSTVFLPYAEIYSAMERGLIDGILQPITGFTGFGWHEVTKYVIEPGVGASSLTYIVNLDTWNRLPEHLKNVMIEVMVEMEKDTTVYAEWIAKEKAIMLEAGMEFIKFSPADAEWFLETMYGASWEEHIEKYPETGPRLKELMVK